MECEGGSVASWVHPDCGDRRTCGVIGCGSAMPQVHLRTYLRCYLCTVRFDTRLQPKWPPFSRRVSFCWELITLFPAPLFYISTFYKAFLCTHLPLQQRRTSSPHSGSPSLGKSCNIIACLPGQAKDVDWCAADAGLTIGGVAPCCRYARLLPIIRNSGDCH
jgi:hypothetical protein